jgi:hypothetical protein
VVRNSVSGDVRLEASPRSLAREVLAATLVLAVGTPLVAAVAIVAAWGTVTALLDADDRRETAWDC